MAESSPASPRPDPVEQETDFALSQDARRVRSAILVLVLVLVLAAVLLMPGTRGNVYNFLFYNLCAPVRSVRLQPPLAAIKCANVRAIIKLYEPKHPEIGFCSQQSFGMGMKHLIRVFFEY